MQRAAGVNRTVTQLMKVTRNTSNLDVRNPLFKQPIPKNLRGYISAYDYVIPRSLCKALKLESEPSKRDQNR